jgi:hypothetical protein
MVLLRGGARSEGGREAQSAGAVCGGEVRDMVGAAPAGVVGFAVARGYRCDVVDARWRECGTSPGVAGLVEGARVLCGVLGGRGARLVVALTRRPG